MIKKDKRIINLFCFFFVIFMVLLSYKVILLITVLTANQQNTIDFLQEKAELELPFTEEEVSHLQDVKKLMKVINYLFYFSLLILTLILTYYKKNVQQVKKLLRYGGITTIVVVLITIFILWLSFSKLFTLFHHVFFPQGNWIFPTDSLLIQTFPIDFFNSISLRIFGLSLFISLILVFFKNIYKIGKV